MKIEYSTCSQSSIERSNPQDEVWCDKSASRNTSELDSASLRYLKVISLSEKLKSDIIGEVTFACSRWTFRGGWRQRVEKEKSRNLRDPVFLGRESDTSIVAKKGCNEPGAKGGCC